jgi:hypothetical protein
MNKIVLLLIVAVMIISPVYAAYIHVRYDWEGDDANEDNDPPPLYESCFACHENGVWPGPTRICEDCHLSGGLGPFREKTVEGYYNYTLRGDYGAPIVYEHYTGAEVNVPSQVVEGAAVTFSTCFGYDNNTGKGTCHGVPDTAPVDGKFAFHRSRGLNQSDPYTYAVERVNLPDSTNCLYCHMQDNSEIREAWGNPTQLSNHYNSTTNSDCYSCHVEGNVVFSFHDATVKLAEGQESSSIAGAGGGAKRNEEFITIGVNTYTSELMRRIIVGLNLRYDTFFESPDIYLGHGVVGVRASLVAPLITTGIYPKPSDTEAVRALAKEPLEISGDAYEVSASHILEKYQRSDKIIIARGDIAVDSMAAISYAKAENIPILLTKPEELPSVTLSAIEKLGPTQIVIVGGPVAVSQEVEAKLSANYNVRRIYGSNRIETAIELAKESSSAIIVITDAINPSTDAALISYLFDAPLLYVDPDGVPKSVEEYLSTQKNIKIVAVGVSPDIVSKLNEIVG